MFASHSLKVSVVKSILADGVVVTGVMPKNSKFPSLSVIISSTGANTSDPKSTVTFMSSSHSISSSSLFDVSVALVISSQSKHSSNKSYTSSSLPV